jgi:hypothetical protein
MGTRLKGKYHLGDLGGDGRIILKCILKKKGAAACIRFNWLRKESKRAAVNTTINLRVS